MCSLIAIVVVVVVVVVVVIEETYRHNSVYHKGSSCIFCVTSCNTELLITKGYGLCYEDSNVS